MDGSRHELLAGSALSGDEHGQIVALQSLNLLDDAGHGRARRQESRQQRLERAIARPVDGSAERSRAAHSANPCCATAAIIRRRAGYRMAERPARRDDHEAFTVRVASEWLEEQTSRSRQTGHAAPSGQASRACRRRSPALATTRRRRRLLHEEHRAVGPETSRSAAAVSRPSSSGSAAASTIRRTMASSASAGEMTYSPVPMPRQERLGGACVAEIAFGAELFEDRHAVERWRSATERAPVWATRRPSARWLSAA